MDGVGIRITMDVIDDRQPDRGAPMTVFERDERYWYSEGWRRLRRNLVSLCLRESGDLLYVLCSEEARSQEVDQAARVFVDKLVSIIQDRLQARPAADIWGHSLRLFAEPDRLSRDLQRQQAQFAADSHDLDPKALLGGALKGHFEMMRRELQTEHSPHRLKVWEQIDRVSRDIRGVNDDTLAVQSIEHLEAVLFELGHRYPKSRNLPRSIGTLEAYFMEFSRSFEPRSLDGELADRLADDRAATPDDLDFLEHVTGMRPDPIDCFRALPEQHAKVFAVAHRLEADLMPDEHATFLSARAYYLSKGISKRRFYRMLQEATKFLVQCLERRIQE